MDEELRGTIMWNLPDLTPVFWLAGIGLFAIAASVIYAVVWLVTHVRLV